MTISLTKHVGTAFLGAFACLAVTVSAQAAEMTGAGSTAIYPVAAKWAEAYKAKTGSTLNYQSIGSGGGIKQIEAKTVDFGASDAPLSVDELNKNGLVQFPAVMIGVVPVVNIPGVGPGQLKLSGSVIADIYLGKIKKWNDPAITAMNADVKLPDMAIAPVYRSDGSGTTFLFTSFLAATSPDWKAQVGANTAVEWKVGMGGKGSEGVTGFTSQTPGSIGYVEYAYALQNKMGYTLVKNKDGNFATPTSASFTAAAAGADWAKAPGMGLVLVNQPGKDSWPIAGATFVLLHKADDHPDKVVEVMKFLDWSYRNGGKMAIDLDYVPIPMNVVDMIEGVWTKDVKTADGKALWPAK